MTTVWITMVGVAITAIASLIGVIWTAGSSRAAARETSRAAPYEQLAVRVTSLEIQVETLRAQLNTEVKRTTLVVSWTRDFWEWVRRGMIGPQPVIPKELHDVLDPEEFMWYPDGITREEGHHG